jgi:hypothetical protein
MQCSKVITNLAKPMHEILIMKYQKVVSIELKTNRPHFHLIFLLHLHIYVLYLVSSTRVYRM